MGPARAQTTRGGWPEPVRRYPCDLADQEWALIGALLPARRPGGPGRPPVHPRRRIVEAILYVDRTGCAWRYLPSEYPPWRTVYGYFTAWRADGSLDRLHDALREQVRAAAGRRHAPSAAGIASQPVPPAAPRARSSRGWDNARKVSGRKRHIAVAGLGLLLAIGFPPPSLQPRPAPRTPL